MEIRLPDKNQRVCRDLPYPKPGKYGILHRPIGTMIRWAVFALLLQPFTSGCSAIPRTTRRSADGCLTGPHILGMGRLSRLSFPSLCRETRSGEAGDDPMTGRLRESLPGVTKIHSEEQFG